MAPNETFTLEKNGTVRNRVDSNAQMPDLNYKYNPTGKALENQLMSYRCQVLNDKDEFTSYRFIEKDGKIITQHSVLDYFIGSPYFATNCDNYDVIKSNLLQATFGS